jgi:ribosomal protein S18 acetylase RimI-like enzyme
MSALTLRIARPADLGDLCELEEACFTGDRLTRRRLRHGIGAPNALPLLLAEETAGPAQAPCVLGPVLGLWRRGPQRARLYSLARAPQARGRGLARALFTSILERLRARGFAGAFLEVAPDDGAAIGLHQSLGFVECGVYPRYSADGQDAPRMAVWF